MSAPTLRTERLVMRGWRASDRAAFAAMNADPKVMEHFPGTMTRAESDGFADRIETHFAEHGFGLWAVEVPGVAEFIGFVGLAVPRFEAHFMPAVEVGWRLAAKWWGRGYATEAAREALRFGFDDARARRDRLVHCRCQRAVTGRDAPDRDDARPGGRLRPPGASSRRQARAACALSTHARRVGWPLAPGAAASTARAIF